MSARCAEWSGRRSRRPAGSERSSMAAAIYPTRAPERYSLPGGRRETRGAKRRGPARAGPRVPPPQRRSVMERRVVRGAGSWDLAGLALHLRRPRRAGHDAAPLAERGARVAPPALVLGGALAPV